jgi:hypothetical protein
LKKYIYQAELIKGVILEIKNDLKLNDLNHVVTEQERLEIGKAVNLPKGSWFKCGDYYCIDACGGPNQLTKCRNPNCDLQIGGRQHKLVEESTFAGDQLWNHKLDDI